MAATDYFDPHTHKGFLSKDIENRRRHLPPSEKRWVWTKKAKGDARESSSTAACLMEPSENADNLDGCPRHVAECVYCEGSGGDGFLNVYIFCCSEMLCSFLLRNGRTGIATSILLKYLSNFYTTMCLRKLGKRGRMSLSCCWVILMVMWGRLQTDMTVCMGDMDMEYGMRKGVELVDWLLNGASTQ